LGGEISAIASFSGGILAGVKGEMYLSTNNGTFWTRVGSGFPRTYVNAFAVSGRNVFAGTPTVAPDPSLPLIFPFRIRIGCRLHCTLRPEGRSHPLSTGISMPEHTDFPLTLMPFRRAAMR
jgi:hypothetical protein